MNLIVKPAQTTYLQFHNNLWYTLLEFLFQRRWKTMLVTFTDQRDNTRLFLLLHRERKHSSSTCLQGFQKLCYLTPLGCRGGRCILRKMLPLLCWRRWRSNSLAGHHLMSAACVPQHFSSKGGFPEPQEPQSKSQNSPLQEEVLPEHSYQPRKSIWQQAKDMPCSSANQNIPTSAWAALSKQNLLGGSENTYTVLQFTLHMRFIFHNAALMEAIAWSKQLLKLAYFCLSDSSYLKALGFCWRSAHPVTLT